jgi:hypothetical protein
MLDACEWCTVPQANVRARVDFIGFFNIRKFERVAGIFD